MKPRFLIAAPLLCTVAVLLPSCSKSETTGSGEFVKLQGAGASFPAPLYTSWFKEFTTSTEGVQVDYQSVGSGTGVKMFMEGTCDFGASDAAMKPEEIEAVSQGVQLLPMTAGSIVLADTRRPSEKGRLPLSGRNPRGRNLSGERAAARSWCPTSTPRSGSPFGRRPGRS